MPSIHIWLLTSIKPNMKYIINVLPIADYSTPANVTVTRYHTCLLISGNKWKISGDSHNCSTMFELVKITSRLIVRSGHFNKWL